MPTVEDIINIGFNNHQGGKLEEAEYAYADFDEYKAEREDK